MLAKATVTKWVKHTAFYNFSIEITYSIRHFWDSGLDSWLMMVISIPRRGIVNVY